MHTRLTPERVLVILQLFADSGHGGVVLNYIGKPRLLDQTVCNVNAETCNAAVKPEAKYRFKFFDDLWVIPIEVWLGRVEDVQVPLAVFDLGPGWSSEY